MNFKKIIIYLLVLSLLIISLCSCNTAKTTVNVKPDEINTAASAVIDENSKFTLSWNEEQKCILLTDKQTANVWSTVPYDFFLQNDTNVNMSSPVFINYYNPSDGSLMTAKALADCIEMNNLSVKTEKGDIILEFYFEDAEVLIPLTVSLEDSGLKVTVNAKDIKESGKTRLIDISVFPYLCSAVNSSDKSNYLFVPVGSGALMYTDEEIQSSSRAYSGEVYGSDAARYILDDNFEEEAIRLPVFGVKANNEALFAIIEQGAESAVISADAGNAKNGHSTVYTTFNLRGYDETEVERADFSDAYVYAKEFNKDAVYSVSYYPLSGEGADYNGMAKLYKDYLTESGQLTKTNTEQKPYLLSFLGGSLVRDVAVGIPYKRMQTATAFSDVTEILKELGEESDSLPAVLLKGFGKDGLDVGRLAGSYTFSKDLGGKKGYLSLKSFCDENEIPLFAEYDLVQFSKSSSGFSTAFDTAQTAGKKLASVYPLKKNIRTGDESFGKISLLQRSELEGAVDKLLKKSDYVSGISLTTLSSIAYSDYSATAYYAKGNMAEQVTALINKVKEENRTVNAGSANGYAAGITDSVTDTPLSNGEYHSLDESIPFYQMIFHGFTSMYSTPLNSSKNYSADLLKAVECGVSPAFAVAKELDSSLADTLSSEYHISLYEGSKETIAETVNTTAEYFGLIGSKEIIAHEILSQGVTKTVFTDGAEVTVNHTEKDVTAQGRVIAAYSFSLKNGNEIKNYKVTGGD